MRGCGCAVLVLLAGAAMADPPDGIAVPSGQTVTLREVLVDDAPGETWVRFRFLAPEIAQDGGSVPVDLAGPDMDHLCDTLALPYLREYDLAAARIVISLSDRFVEFGSTDPDATQLFEAYRPDDPGCVWEGL